MAYRPDSRIPLTVFDTCPIVEGSTACVALHNTLDLAQLADQLGYLRYWVAEHHGMKGVASCATPVLIGQIASATQYIRVGAGAVLLSNHSSLVLAEEFGTLEAFHPGRIDMGIGRALGGRREVIERVRSESERTAATFTEQLSELMGYFALSADKNSVRAIPAIGNRPPIWLLGSTGFSATLAASLGLPYAFAGHLNPDGMAAAVRQYRTSFQASSDLAAPRVMVSVAAIAAETDEQAKWLAGSIKYKILSRMNGEPIQLPSPADAEQHLAAGSDTTKLLQRVSHYVVGSPQTVKTGLQNVLEKTGADELAIQVPIYSHVDRRRSYEIIAELRDGLRSMPGLQHV